MAGPRPHGQSGFTIIEVLIALSLFFLVLGGIFQLFGPSNVMHAASQRKVDIQQSGRVGMDTLVRQLRMAGYFPENFDANTGNDIAAAQQNAIQFATDTALAIHGASNGCLDANADTVCDADQSPAQPRSMVYLFCLSGTMLLSKQGVVGAAPSYTCSVDSMDQREVVADNITGLTFTYYDGNNNLLAGPLDGQNAGAVPNFGVTAQRDIVRTVVITVTAQEAVPGQAAQVYTLTSNVRLRNLNP